MRNSIIKIISIFCLIIFIIGIIGAWNSPASGYESSIYISTPLVFWISVILCVLVGIIIIISQIYSEHHKITYNNFIYIGLILIFLAFAAISSLLILRGYVLWAGGDPLTHLGIIRQIINTGHVDRQIFYPIAHIYMAEWSEICNIPIIILSKYIPFIFGLLSVAFSYCLAKVILYNKNQIILGTILSMTFLSGWFFEFTPNHLANLTFPLAFYLLLKCFVSDKLQWKVLFIINVFLFPIFHPIVGIIMLLILLAVLITKIILKGMKNKFPNIKQITTKFGIAAAFLVFVWTVTWISSFYIWNYTIHNIYTLIMENGPKQINTLIGQINYAASYNYSVTEMFFKTYGGLLILYVLTIFAIIILWRQRHLLNNLKILNLLIGPLLIITLFIIVLYTANLPFGPGRIFAYIVIISNIFSAFILYEIINPDNVIFAKIKINFRLITAIIILISLFILGSLKIYPSRYVLQASDQITQTEINGMNWFLYKDNTNMQQTFLYITVYRFADLLLTSEEKNGRDDIRNLPEIPPDLKLPWHFGYDKGPI